MVQVTTIDQEVDGVGHSGDREDKEEHLVSLANKACRVLLFGVVGEELADRVFLVFPVFPVFLVRLVAVVAVAEVADRVFPVLPVLPVLLARLVAEAEAVVVVGKEALVDTEALVDALVGVVGMGLGVAVGPGYGRGGGEGGRGGWFWKYKCLHVLKKRLSLCILSIL